MGDDLTHAVTRGLCRLLWHHGLAPLTEVPLPDGHRADVMAVGPDGRLWIAEVKTSWDDLRFDRKWPAYRAWCDLFLWAVPVDLAPALEAETFLPDATGLVVADAHGAVFARPGRSMPLPPARRRALTIRLARVAATRALRLTDPGLDGAAS
ncbi:MAG: MmcB family DNA repair protein [Sphingomonadaceae bacterium]|uniref:MmcB family DNA repair protein n=1 Tax=Thermaurantiacus sp. TaxID=2820283 RepID=UPI00298F1E9F|nr:MmcB family DNA repair protein [Thermaurantiacus sp.]MCS6986214.1 MmcB family DNA repair protein [Sphingomonadaceae bacterium]MDW8415871.1 MmcB family DNA repair protein [Thermaurantiacus sp.]